MKKKRKRRDEQINKVNLSDFKYNGLTVIRTLLYGRVLTKSEDIECQN